MNLEEVYAQVGEYTVKFVIDPSRSPDIDHVDVRLTNADGRPMDFSFKRWGTKINLSFMIDGSTPDGVFVIDIDLRGRQLGKSRERFPCWVVK